MNREVYSRTKNSKDEWMIMQGNCIEKMQELEENSIDALVSDPPYGLAFMGKDWDNFKPRAFQEFSYQWGEQALRILKPGSWLLAFSGTRTYHRMVCGLEDAGFEISNMLIWMYGSGFPKSLDISKAIDQYYGLEREITREAKEEFIANGNTSFDMRSSKHRERKDVPISEEAQHWNGWFTQLKPALEPIVLAQKPREGTFAENVLKWGVGGLNIDECRIQYGDKETDPRVDTNAIWNGKRPQSPHTVSLPPIKMQMYKNKGRYPSNVLLTHHPECKIIGMKEVGSGKIKHNQEINRQQPNRNVFKFGFDPNGCKSLGNYGVQMVPAYECHPDCPILLLDEQSGITSKGGYPKLNGINPKGEDHTLFGEMKENKREIRINTDIGGASRFFYSGKAHKSERNAGLKDLEHVENTEMVNRKEGSAGIENPRAGAGRGKGAKNDIATLKPINLMRYLVRLVCLKGGTVIDPFAGSGTTGIACVIEGMNYILIEKRERFANIIIPKRLNYWKDPAHWDVLNDHNALPELKIMKNKKQFKDIRSFGGRE